MHLAVFGDTFDPPHNGHLALCLFARELLGIDRIIISVSNNPFNQKRDASDEHRTQMAELLAAEINRNGACCEVIDWELGTHEPSYTVDLMRSVSERYLPDKLTLLVGEDSFKEFPAWKEITTLFALCTIVVFRRPSAEVSTPASWMHREVLFIDFACQISSTHVRRLLYASESVSGLVPVPILQYIKQRSLYLRQPHLH